MQQDYNDELYKIFEKMLIDIFSMVQKHTVWNEFYTAASSGLMQSYMNL